MHLSFLKSLWCPIGSELIHIMVAICLLNFHLRIMFKSWRSSVWTTQSLHPTHLVQHDRLLRAQRCLSSSLPDSELMTEVHPCLFFCSGQNCSFLLSRGYSCFFFRCQRRCLNRLWLALTRLSPPPNVIKRLTPQTRLRCEHSSSAIEVNLTEALQRQMLNMLWGHWLAKGRCQVKIFRYDCLVTTSISHFIIQLHRNGSVLLQEFFGCWDDKTSFRRASLLESIMDGPKHATGLFRATSFFQRIESIKECRLFLQYRWLVVSVNLRHLYVRLIWFFQIALDQSRLAMDLLLGQNDFAFVWGLTRVRDWLLSDPFFSFWHLSDRQLRPLLLWFVSLSSQKLVLWTVVTSITWWKRVLWQFRCRAASLGLEINFLDVL